VIALDHAIALDAKALVDSSCRQVSFAKHDSSKDATTRPATASWCVADESCWCWARWWSVHEKGVVTSIRVVVRTTIVWCCCDEDNDRRDGGHSSNAGIVLGPAMAVRRLAETRSLTRAKMISGRDGPIRTTTI
jgi:hypothetical protein